MISTIIPTLDEEKYLPLLFASLKKQSYKNFEVIVIDASSNNLTKKVVESRGKTIYLKAKRKGTSVQRNQGAKIARGNILLFLDADMSIPDKNFLERLSKINGVAVSFPVKVKETQETKKDKRMHMIYNIAASLLGGSRGAIAIKKQIFDKIHGYNEKLQIAEDVDLIKKAKKYGRVLWASKLIVEEDIRRYKKEGYFKITLDYCIDGIMAHILGRTRNNPRGAIR